MTALNISHGILWKLTVERITQLAYRWIPGTGH